MLPKSTQKICAGLLFPKQYGYKWFVTKSALCNHFYSTCFCLVVFLLFSFNSFAQFDPRVNCTNGCTSNDIQIKTAYLVDRTTHAALASNFQCQGTASVKLALELTTKTPRVGVYIYARIVNKNNPLQELGIVSECFSTSLESVAPLTTKVVFNELVGWPCGTPIVLTDVFIGWGTGNKDFCEGSPLERCPGTPSKCYSLPPGEYITVIVPTAASTTSEKCSTTPGGTTASFNLESLNNDVIGAQQNVSVTWYSNIGLTTPINNPTNFVSSYAEVYAKVSNNSDPSVYSSSTVILNVFVTPVANAASASLCSTSPGGTTASFNLTGLEAAVLNGQTGVTLAWYSDAGLQNAISSPYVTGSTTVYAKVTNTDHPSCNSSVAVPLTVNRTPTATTTSATLCSSAPGGTTASFNLTSLEAAVINGQQNVSVTWYSNVGLTTPISSPHVTGTTTVYAKVSNNSATSCFSSVEVALTVNRTPTATTTSSTLCSSAPGGTTASFNLTNLEAAVINGQQDVSVTWFSNVGLTTPISSPHVTGTTTVYAKVSNNNATSCYSSAGVSLTVNRTPTVTSTSATLCSTEGAGTTASFDLNALATTIINGQSNVSLSWFSDAAFQNAISSPYVTGTTTVYAKVTNTNAVSCTNSIEISLTVNSRPGIITANVTPPTCAVPTGTITVTSSKVGLTFSLNSTNPADFTNATGVFASLAPGNYTIRSKSAAGCISDGVTKEVTAAPGGTPAADVVIVTNPSCSSSTGTLKVVKAGSLADYDNTIFEFSNGGGWTSNPVFSFTAGAGYSITVRRISDHTCFAIASCEGEAPIAEQGGNANSGSQLNQETIISPLKIRIKAIPNPFADRVRFAVTNERAGNGTLDVFNMQGQKIKTVYSGYVPAGTSYYDLEVVGQSSGQLIYILRIGSEKLSGKLLQVNK
jgi:hypothetical protein